MNVIVNLLLLFCFKKRDRIKEVVMMMMTGVRKWGRKFCILPRIHWRTIFKLTLKIL